MTKYFVAFGPNMVYQNYLGFTKYEIEFLLKTQIIRSSKPVLNMVDTEHHYFVFSKFVNKVWGLLYS